MTLFALLLHPALWLLPVHPAPAIDCSTIPPEAPPIAACWDHPIVVPLPPGTTVVTTKPPVVVTTTTATPPYCDSTVVHFTPEPGDVPIVGSPWFCPATPHPTTTAVHPAPPAIVTGCVIKAGTDECVSRQQITEKDGAVVSSIRIVRVP